MTRITNDELLDALADLRALFPDWRLGQLVANLATAAGGVGVWAIWDMEDDSLLAAAKRLIDRNQSRSPAVGAASGAGDD